MRTAVKENICIMLTFMQVYLPSLGYVHSSVALLQLITLEKERKLLLQVCIDCDLLAVFLFSALCRACSVE